MTFLPIVARELRLKSRKPRTYYARCAMAGAATLMCLGLITLTLSAVRNPARIGQDLFWGFSSVGFLFSLLAGPVVAADCLSEEKRDGTLGLLFLTDLKGYDVVLGKLVATSMPAFYALLAAIPILALSFFLGGVTAGEFWRMTAVLVMTMGFSLATGLFVSAISRDGRRAFLSAGAILLILTLAPWMVLVVRPNGFLAGALAAVPSAGPLFVGVTDSRYAVAPPQFWRALFVLCLSSVLLLAMASLLLPHCWQERGSASRQGRWPPTTWRTVWQRRQDRRRRKLEYGPMLWLAERTALNPWATHAFWISSLAVWVGGFVALRNRSVPQPVVYGAVYGLHVIVKWWVAWEASRRFAEDKRSGAIELLLTTPLNERALLVGWLLGLKRRFLAPVLAIFALDAHLCWSSESGEWLLGMMAAVGLFVADSYALCWVGLWMGLTAKNSSQAFLATIGRVLVLPWFCFLAFFGVWGLLGQGSGLSFAPGWLAVIWFAGSYALDVGFCAWGINKLSDDFRLAAADQIGGVRVRRFLLPFPGRLGKQTA
jgi:ABC-type transport system involved in multi-copper enzyme maturation permease subunit